MTTNFRGMKLEVDQLHRTMHRQGSLPEEFRHGKKQPSSVIHHGSTVTNLPTTRAHFHIPKTLCGLLNSGVNQYGQLLKLFPVLGEDLTMGNYAEKFHLLLHLEEYHDRLYGRHKSATQIRFVQMIDHEIFQFRLVGAGREWKRVGFPDRVVLTSSNGEIYDAEVHLVSDDLVALHVPFGEGRSLDATASFRILLTYGRQFFRHLHNAMHEVWSRLGDAVLFPSKGTACEIAECQATVRLKIFDNSLSRSQRSAVEEIISGPMRPEPYIITGPPGTGKTRTLIEVLLQLTLNNTESRIVVCSLTASSLELLFSQFLDTAFADKVAEMGGSVLLLPKNSDRYQESLTDLVRGCVMTADSFEWSCRRLIFTTCETAATIPDTIRIRSNIFSHIFLDDCEALLEPEAMLAISCLFSTDDTRIVMVGDVFQLGPRDVRSLSGLLGLQNSYLFRLLNLQLYQPMENGKFDSRFITYLTENFRNYSGIMTVSSKLLYDDQIRLRYIDRVEPSDAPLKFWSVCGVMSRRWWRDGYQYYNETEVTTVKKILEGLYLAGVSSEDVGIISPFSEQIERIKSKLCKTKIPKIGLVKDFVGDQKDVVIISCVQSHPNFVWDAATRSLSQGHGFLDSPEISNFAVSRACLQLHIIANQQLFNKDLFWGSLIATCQQGPVIHL